MVVQRIVNIFDVGDCNWPDANSQQQRKKQGGVKISEVNKTCSVSACHRKKTVFLPKFIVEPEKKFE